MHHEQGIGLRYDPQVDLASGVLVGVNAVAWAHGAGLLGTRIAANCVSGPGGFTVPLGEWVLRQACLETGRWQREGAGGFQITVKVSALELLQDSYEETLRAILRESGVEARRIELEIEEAAAVAHVDALIGMLPSVRRLGVRLALGGFGRIRCPLGVLQRLEFDQLKIHPSFLRMDSAQDRLPIARGIIELASSLRMGVLAEGIETRRAAELVAGYGCHAGQGRYYGCAIPPPVLAAGLWVAASKAGRWTPPPPWLSDQTPRVRLKA